MQLFVSKSNQHPSTTSTCFFKVLLIVENSIQ